MNDSLYVKGYTIVENFFTKQQVDFYMSQVVEEMSLNRLHLAADIENEEKLHPATWNVNSNPIWQNTMYSFLPQISKIVDEELVPIYSYQRIYLRGAQLANHTDWPWCQISLSVNLGQSHQYPMYITDMQNKIDVEIIQKPGDAIFYIGHNTTHYRNQFEGDWYSQLFLHYVIANDEQTKHHRFDPEIFNFQLSDKMEKIFYPIETEKLKTMKISYDMKEQNKGYVKPLDSMEYKTTNRIPRIEIDDVTPDAKMKGGQYKTKKLDQFMDSVHQTRKALSSDFCKELIDFYEDYNGKGKTFHGLTHKGLDNKYKNTGELNLLDLPELKPGEKGEHFISKIVTASDHCILQYTKKYGLLEHYNPSELGAGRAYYPVWEIHKYDKGVGHYESWHTEGSHLYEYGNRMFVSMFYLNDVEEGGRTVFPFAGAGIKCEEGKHLTFPCMWPYVHYAQTPESDDKYILTTWLMKLWPDHYMQTFSKVEGHEKEKDVRKTKFIFEEK